MLVSIIIPVYNEENFIKELLIRINKINNINKEIIVVNDKSSDRTKSILENECNLLYSKLIHNENNMGKGYSCRKGILEAKGEIIIIQDADLEYNPENYDRLIKPIQNKNLTLITKRRENGYSQVREWTHDRV